MATGTENHTSPKTCPSSPTSSNQMPCYIFSTSWKHSDLSCSIVTLNSSQPGTMCWNYVGHMCFYRMLSIWTSLSCLKSSCPCPHLPSPRCRMSHWPQAQSKHFNMMLCSIFGSHFTPQSGDQLCNPLVLHNPDCVMRRQWQLPQTEMPAHPQL